MALAHTHSREVQGRLRQQNGDSSSFTQSWETQDRLPLLTKLATSLCSKSRFFSHLRRQAKNYCGSTLVVLRKLQNSAIAELQYSITVSVLLYIHKNIIHLYQSQCFQFGITQHTSRFLFFRACKRYSSVGITCQKTWWACKHPNFCKNIYTWDNGWNVDVFHPTYFCKRSRVESCCMNQPTVDNNVSNSLAHLKTRNLLTQINSGPCSIHVYCTMYQEKQ